MFKVKVKIKIKIKIKIGSLNEFVNIADRTKPPMIVVTLLIRNNGDVGTQFDHGLKSLEDCIGVDGENIHWSGLAEKPRASTV